MPGPPTSISSGCSRRTPASTAVITSPRSSRKMQLLTPLQLPSHELTERYSLRLSVTALSLYSPVRSPPGPIPNPPGATPVSPPPAAEPGRESEVRDRIFASALRRFSHKGFAATSLREISEDAQTTKPMIYYYFGSKEGLYASIVRQILEEMAEGIRSHLHVEAPVQDRVVAYCERYLEHFLQQEEIIPLALREGL